VAFEMLISSERLSTVGAKDHVEISVECLLLKRIGYKNLATMGG
jgi:hypothetical protein